MKHKNDISTRDDIRFLVDQFYDQVKQKPTLNYIFSDVAKVDWPTHLPKMYDFWSSIILQDHSYAGNPMQKHISLSQLTSMTEVEFTAWLDLFYETVDTHFEGTNAAIAKQRATNIARLMQHKIEQRSALL